MGLVWDRRGEVEGTASAEACGGAVRAERLRYWLWSLLENKYQLRHFFTEVMPSYFTPIHYFPIEELSCEDEIR